MARSVVFNGVTLWIPDAYSALDLSQLLSPASAGVGQVGLVGESDGGAPGLHFYPGGASSAIIQSDIVSGPGADMANLALRAGTDPLVQAGASAVYFYKTNLSSQSALNIINGGNVALTLVTDQYGTLSSTYSASIAQSGGSTFVTTYNAQGVPEVSVGVGSTQYATIERSNAGGATTATIELAYNGSSRLILTGVTSLATEFAIDVTLLTLAQIQALVNGFAGWTMTITSPAYNAFLPANLDIVLTPANCFQVAYGFVASIYEYQSWAAQSSMNVTIVRGTGNNAIGIPTSLAQTVFKVTTTGTTASSTTITAIANMSGILVGQSVTGAGIVAGTVVTALGTNQITISQAATASASGVTLSFAGTRGATTNTYVQNAYNAMLGVRLNIIVPLFSDNASTELSRAYSPTDPTSTYTISSVFAINQAHVDNRSSILGRSECQSYIGVHGSLTAFLAQCATTNDRWIACTSQQITDLNVSGTLVSPYPSFAFAVVCAQTQAGSPVGTPLTYRQIPSQGITQDISWTPIANGVQIIQGGGMYAAVDENNTLRIVNGYTTWLADSNDANIKIETVYSLAVFAFNHRQYMKSKFLGQSSFTKADVTDAIADSVKNETNVTKSIAGYDLSQLVINAIGGDTLNYDVPVIPWVGTCFVLPTIVALPNTQ